MRRLARSWRSYPGATIRFTKAEGDARRFATRSGERWSEIVIAAGGDGTLNEVVNGLAPQADRVRVGLIPLGTGNDFARMLDLPHPWRNASK